TLVRSKIVGFLALCIFTSNAVPEGVVAVLHQRLALMVHGLKTAPGAIAQRIAIGLGGQAGRIAINVGMARVGAIAHGGRRSAPVPGEPMCIGGVGPVTVADQTRILVVGIGPGRFFRCGVATVGGYGFGRNALLRVVGEL